MNKLSEFSFQKGWSQVKQGEICVVRSKLMTVLGIKTRMAFLDRLNGKVEPRVSEYRAIEAVFEAHGISHIWGGRDR